MTAEVAQCSAVNYIRIPGSSSALGTIDATEIEKIFAASQGVYDSYPRDRRLDFLTWQILESNNGM